MKLLKFPESSLLNTAATLRRIADEIEKDKYGQVKSAVLILEGEALNVFGTGCADWHRAIALLRLGEHHLISEE